MAVDLLIHAFEHRKAYKGTIQMVKESPTVWGTSEGLPNYIHLIISNATLAEAKDYLSPWKSDFGWELLSSNAQGRRYTISINPRLLPLIDNAKLIKAKMRDLLINEYGGSVVDYNQAAGYLTIDIPNTDWAAVRDDILDRFEDVHIPRRWYFASTDVDAVVAAGGTITRTKAQVAGKIIDRAAE